MSDDLQKRRMRESLFYYFLKRKISFVVLLLFVLLSVKCTFENSEEKKERELFDQALGNINAGGVTSIKLSEITQFEWETVCDVHPYWGELYLEQYDRTYRGPGSQAHDGTWVLVFIAHDGSPKYMWEVEKSGVLIKTEGIQQCFSKEEALLNKIVPFYNWPQYQLEREFQK